MEHADLSAEQLAVCLWPHQPPGSPCLSVAVEDLTADFQWHGNAENVRGDIAFAQSIIETGWFRYGGSVQCGQNKYGGFLRKAFPAAPTGGGGANPQPPRPPEPPPAGRPPPPPAAPRRRPPLRPAEP